MADVEREWVSLESPTMRTAGHGSNPCQGLYHRARGTRPKVAFIATHYNVDFAEHYLAPFLAARGYGFLGWNTRYRGNEALFTLDQALIDIGVGMRWLREEAGAERIVVLGNSGGGSLMGAYQSHATSANVTGAPDDLLAADYYISLNAHPGRPEVLTAWMDPSVVDETDPLSVDADLDLFAEGRPLPLDAGFLATYRAAQRARNDRITRWVQREMERLGAAGAYDRVFPLFRVWADPRFVDLSLDPSDRKPGCYAGDPRWANYSPFTIGSSCTLRAWLSMWSLQTSQCQGVPHLQRITVPSFVIQSTADRGVFPSDATTIFEALAAPDKTLEWLPGEHYFEDGGRDGLADLIAAWTSARDEAPWGD